MVDSTLVKEPGKTGSQWRIHYSLQWPQLKCDYFQISGTEGNGTGESLKSYPLKAGEYVIGDRGFCRGRVFTLRQHGARTLVRLNTGSVRLQNSDQSPFPLLSRLSALKKAGESREWTVWVPSDDAELPANAAVRCPQERRVNPPITQEALSQSQHQPTNTRSSHPALR